MLAPSMGEAARPAWTHAACADVECGDTNGDCCAQHPARASTCDVEMVDAENTTPNSIITKDVMDTFATMAEILRQLHGANIGGDAECDFTFGPPPGVPALEDMKITFHAGTTVRPCAAPATASVEAGITLPMISSTEEVCSSVVGSCGYIDTCTGTCATPDGHMDTMVGDAITALKASGEMKGEVAYTNSITCM